ncbi:hydrogenase maturation protease [Moorella sulfitireducens (nom. illeg.)]|uniref:hydrogenase maturation protease n=1 Tax=Neomoorella sulfitireducens TaxID=2972948 RepID=UPI0021ACD1CE|nr:hydrogenase maturation protease [Moorella sulfitireducens]
MRRVVIGCGNPLAGDDGVGLKVIEELERRELPPGVKTIPAGLPGLSLLDYLRGAEQAIIVDAVHAGQEPGTVICCQEKEVARFSWRSLSLHSLGIGETLALGRLADPGGFPSQLILVGIQAGSIVPGETSLSPPVTAALPLAMKTIYRLLGGGEDA